MKRVMMVALILAVAGISGTGWAADTANISVTVSLATVIEVSLDKTTWNIGPVALGSTSAAEAFVATVGNTVTKLEVAGTDAAGGWVLGTAGADAFGVAVSGMGALTTANQTLDAGVAAYGTKGFSLTYSAPTSDTLGGGVDQGFSVTVTASAP